MRIGDFARLAGVSVRTLRFYDQVGLLSAAGANASSGYRSYDVRQLPRLRQIRAFQELGFSLKEIVRLLRADLSEQELRARMEERRVELQRDIHEDLSRLERIDAHLRNLVSGCEAHSAITLQQSNSAWIVSLRAKLRTYDEAEAMFQELERKVPSNLLVAQRSAFWHSCESSTGCIDCEVVRYVKQPVSSIRGVKSYQLPATTVASLFHAGNDDAIGESYSALNRWLASSHFRLRGPKREIYWADPPSSNNSQAVTEIQFPLMRVAARRQRAA